MKSDRIDALRKREAAIRAALAAENIKLAKREKRDTEKLHRIVGEACCNAAKQNADSFGPALRRVLDSSVTTEAMRDLLRRKGLL